MLKLSQAYFKSGPMGIHSTTVQTVGMAKVKTHFKKPRPRYFFREWRRHRSYTQEELAGMIGVSPPSISQLENGKQGFDSSTLEALAEALRCSPGDLLMRNPLDDEAPWSIWDRIPKSDRAKLLPMLEAYAKTGTDRK
jgi:transcriptional regulator with XRE-family HTH domain